MRITKESLKQIIKEEYERLVNEGGDYDPSDIMNQNAVTADGRRLKISVGWFLRTNSIDELASWQAKEVRAQAEEERARQKAYKVREPSVIINEPKPLKQKPNTELARYPEYARPSQAYFSLRKEGLKPSEIFNDPFLLDYLKKDAKTLYMADEPYSKNKIKFTSDNFEQTLRSNPNKLVFTPNSRLD